MSGQVSRGSAGEDQADERAGFPRLAYTVEVRNRFKGPDLIDRVPDELWTEVRDIVQETGIKPIPMEKKCKKQNGCLGRPYK